jgi:hypothetical protein
MSPAKPGNTRRWMGTAISFAWQDAAGQVVGWVSNRTEPFFWSKPKPLAGYPDPWLTLFVIRKQLRLTKHYRV